MVEKNNIIFKNDSQPNDMINVWIFVSALDLKGNNNCKKYCARRVQHDQSTKHEYGTISMDGQIVVPTRAC